jgi:quercetin dioxygenase-like cupin family protein
MMVVMNKKVWLAGLLSLTAVIGLMAQGPVPKAASAKTAEKNAGPIIDNARVRVWLDSQPGTRRPLNDAVSVFIAPDKATATFLPKGGGVAGPLVVGAGMITGGTTPSKSAAAFTSLHVELKDVKVEPLANKSGFPNAFPRPGVKQLLDNAKVTVWEYRWTPGQPTPMHFHDKDVVVLYLEDGALTSTLPNGEKTVNEYKPGMVKFNNRDRIHTEVLSRGTQRAVMVELK